MKSLRILLDLGFTKKEAQIVITTLFEVGYSLKDNKQYGIKFENLIFTRSPQDIDHIVNTHTIFQLEAQAEVNSDIKYGVYMAFNKVTDGIELETAALIESEIRLSKYKFVYFFQKRRIDLAINHLMDRYVKTKFDVEKILTWFI